MLTFFTIVIALLLIASLAFFCVSLYVWMPSIAAILLALSLFTSVSWWWLVPAWGVFLAGSVLFGVPQVRRAYLSKPMLAYFQRVQPAISATEQEALDAGDSWWEGELFRGKPDWRKLHALPKPALSENEQAFLDKQVATLCGMLDEWQITQDGDLPPAVWDYIKKEKFWGMIIPTEYQGLGFSALAHSAVITKIASRSITAAITVMVPNSLGAAKFLINYGTEQQKKQYLPRLASGEDISCFALTGPTAGSDAASMPDEGIVCKGTYQGKEIIGMRLNWDKRYISLAPIATLVGLAFKLKDPEGLLGKRKNLGITFCIIPTNQAGIEQGARHAPLGMALQNGPIRGRDVFVPLDCIIGGPEMIGCGWRMLMESLGMGRSISLPALSTAVAKLAYRTTGAYARLRKQFKLSIGRFEGVEEALARIGGYTYLLEACRTMTVTAVDQGIKPALVSAIAKYHMTELARQVVNDAVDVHGGRGVQLGPRNYLAYAYQALPICITVEGANILTRNLMIFGQGAIRCHPFIRDELQAALEPDQQLSLKHFDASFLQHCGYALSNVVRTLAFSLSGGYLIKAPYDDDTAYYYRQLTRMSSALAVVSDVTLALLGGSLKRKERLSARLGDVLSQLYLASTTLKYFADNDRSLEDLPYVQWVLETCLYKIQKAFDEFFANFPVVWVGRVLKRLIFPWGRAYQMPQDKLGQLVAQCMLEPSAFRDRLTQDCFIGDAAVGQLEQAFLKMIAAEVPEQKLKEAIQGGRILRTLEYAEQITLAVQRQILTAEEGEALKAFTSAQAEAIAVDEFAGSEDRRQRTEDRNVQSSL